MIHIISMYKNWRKSADAAVQIVQQYHSIIAPSIIEIIGCKNVRLKRHMQHVKIATQFHGLRKNQIANQVAEVPCGQERKTNR